MQGGQTNTREPFDASLNIYESLNGPIKINHGSNV